MPQLKDYQRAALEMLRDYLRECTRSNDPDTAFYGLTRRQHGRGIPYRPVQGLDGMPYVCIRVPTGGGKTLMACHSVGIATRELLRTTRAVVLWLVPSNAILEQTLKALRDRNHFYRQALEQELNGPVTVLDVGEALYLSRPVVDSTTVVIVATIQAFRVEDTNGRKVYETNGVLMDHFASLPREIMDELETNAAGLVTYSLANVLQAHQPILVVDEAHNARTPLSFETLARFKPACIIEFTATPDTQANPSNVLYTVSAAELKAEDMIKLPIQLTTRADWQELLADAIAARDQLEGIARHERQETGEYIRPIMLLQAQPRYHDRPTVTVDVVRQTLLGQHRIPAEQVKEATGENNELYEISDILVEGCPVRYVITVQALREGWDCPFAYVLCSVSELHSPTAVEQILGRVLRMPNATHKQHAQLNRAYAFVTSARFGAALDELADVLVERNGFERQEVGDMIAAAERATREETLPLFSEELTVQAPLISARGRALAPSERGEPFRVPQLAVQLEGLLEVFDETHFREEPWSLKDKDALLSEAEFSPHRSEGRTWSLDISDQGKVKLTFLESLRGRQMLLNVDNWTVGELIYWLARNIRHDDLETEDLSLFLQRMVRSLLDERKLTLEYLVHNKLALRDAAETKVEEYRSAAHLDNYQPFLLKEGDT
ncbi:MAG: restriction endonuclease subunit R, partial [Planctomycetes bacterium]|nr:restriction endonuclease subunit R [Planctomycetota bacterium]